VAFLVAACSGGAPSPDALRAEAGLPSVSDVQAEFRASLQPSDPSEKIEALFKKHNLDATYDRIQSSYHAIMRSPNTQFYAIEIDVKVDNEKRVVAVNVFESFTMP
jgi:hypothetical protein